MFLQRSAVNLLSSVLDTPEVITSGWGGEVGGERLACQAVVVAQCGLGTLGSKKKLMEWVEGGQFRCCLDRQAALMM